MAQTSGIWGVITDLSRQYNVSRTFIYSLLATFKEEMANIFFPKGKSESISEEEIQAFILAQRFEGKSSIDAISTLMKRFGIPNSSQGFVSQILSSIGKVLPKILKNKDGKVRFVIFADDEIFAKSLPILITVDPISSAILRIELTDQRTADNWSDHFEEIVNAGFFPLLLTSDAGTGICSAHDKTFPDTPWQSDTFHGIAHRLGDRLRILEKKVYSAIDYAIDRDEKLASAKSDPVIDKRLNLCFEAYEAVEQAFELYDDFEYLYKALVHQLNVFDSQGNLRQKDQAQGDMEAALELMESLDDNTINKIAPSIRKALPDLLTYFDTAPAVIKNCEELTSNQDALSMLYLAWQWNKAVIKSKKSSRKKRAIEQRDYYLELAELFIGEEKEYTELKEKVFSKLDTIVQASSMVECINSILRPYLNCFKNQVTQEFLNTFMFYHNHRRYHDGKRKGKTPMELLTGEEQKEDWIELLLKTIKEKKSTLTA